MTSLGAPYTRRVKVGSYYTNGTHLAEVVGVGALGTVTLQHAAREVPPVTCGIDAFRGRWWLVRERATGACTCGFPDTPEEIPPRDPACAIHGSGRD